jgi:hypothetical protein
MTREIAVKNVAGRRTHRDRRKTGHRVMSARHREKIRRPLEMIGHRLATSAHRATSARREMNAHREMNVPLRVIDRVVRRMARRLVRGPDRGRGGEPSRRARCLRHSLLFRASS